MRRLKEARDGLPTSNNPHHRGAHARLLNCFNALCLGIICFVVLHTESVLPSLPSLSFSSNVSASQNNDACPQLPPFQIPESSPSLKPNTSNHGIEPPSGDQLAHLLSGAVQIDTSVGDEWPTVAQDPSRWETVFAPFHNYLGSSFPLIYAADSPIKRERVNEWGLVYTYPGTNPSLPPLVLMAHQDVVPVEPETIPSWTHARFSGFIDHHLGLVWGRGASDCKASLISILATIESLLKAGFEPQRTVVCSFGFDEESAGTQGGTKLGEFLHQRYGDDGVAMIVDEGGQISLDLGIPVAAPAVAEKGYLDARVTVSTPGGHSSTPRAHTSIGLLAHLITAIEAHPFPPTIHISGKHPHEVNPALQYLQCTRDAPNADAKLAKALKKLERTQRKIGQGGCVAKCTKRWLHRKLERQAEKVLSLMTREQRFGFQTTQAVDLISGGVKINALPEQASAVINHRIDVT